MDTFDEGRPSERRASSVCVLNWMSWKLTLEALKLLLFFVVLLVMGGYIPLCELMTRFLIEDGYGGMEKN